MTFTTGSPTVPATSMPAGWQRLLAVVAVLSCVPYAVLKAMWLLGSDVGLVDDRLLGNTAMVVANLVTLLMSLSGAALAVAMVRPVGLRLPAWLVLPPIFVGTGLLGAILVLVPIQPMLGAHGSQPRDYPDDPIEGWVYIVVYGGFVLLGVCLLTLSAAYARRRWLVPDGWTTPMRTWRPAFVRQRRVAIAHCLFMLALCICEAAVVADADRIGGSQVVAVVMALACLAGTVALAIRRPGGRTGTLPVLAAFVGAAAVASWGLYFFVILTVPNPLADAGPAVPAALVVVQALKAVNGALTVLVIHRLRPTHVSRHILSLRKT